MKQLREDEITSDDLEAYLETTSDFEFEIRILKMLTDRRLNALHGGSYLDSLTGKKRQFDLRCQIRPRLEFRRGLYETRLAIECKNIGAHFPLLVQCIPRAGNESWHEIIATSDRGVHQFQLWNRQSCYPRGHATGKSLSQVGYDTTNKKGFVATDSDVFEKWAQALSSARGLAYSTAADVGSQPKFTLVMPVVVVPNDRLWVACYDDAGNRTQSPTAVDRVPYFVSEQTAWTHEGRDIVFNISHLEFVTEAGLSTLVDHLHTEDSLERYFDEDEIERYCVDLFAGKLDANPAT